MQKGRCIFLITLRHEMEQLRLYVEMKKFKEI